MVLATLWEQPTHPYQLVQTLKGRQKDKSARLNYGSLYSVIANLEKAGLIEVVEVTKSGNLPPRTTYKVTEYGITELTDWLSTLIANPEPEIPHFMTALSILPALSPEEAVRLLRQRVDKLKLTLAQMAAERERSRAIIPELLSIESQYLEALTKAEYDFTNQLIDDILTEKLGGVSVWRAIQARLVDGHIDYDAVSAALADEGYSFESLAMPAD
jgi:DNA-binding PadR family transcriptional regulator